MPKVVIVGAGSVGTTLAYTLQLTGVATEIVLIDSNHELAEGQVMDMNHGLPFVPPVHIHAGGYPDCKGAEVIVITAGARQKKDESRLASLIAMLKYVRVLWTASRLIRKNLCFSW